MQNEGRRMELRPRKKAKKIVDQESGNIIHDESESPFLPDEIIIDIISRLSTKDALRLRCVCKRLRDLIFSSEFIHLLHIKHRTSSSSTSVPLILVMNGPGIRQQFLLHKCWGSQRTRSKIIKSCHLYPEYSMQLSHDGLIVSKKHKSPGKFIIFNPIYPENVKITLPAQPQSEILGIFYHSSMKEYCTLWEMSVSSSGAMNVQYKMLNLGYNQPHWREIKNPFTQSEYGRIQEIRPVLVNEYLYWAVEYQSYDDSKCNVDVIEFNTRSEGFEAMHCPIPVVSRRYICNINLLNVKGLLSLVQVHTPSQSYIIIWTLEDRVNKIWTSSEYSINAKQHLYQPKAIAFWNGQLAIQSDQSLLICNLRLGTTRKFGKEEYHDSASFVSHAMSLASLKNCKSEICMVEEDKNEPKSIWWKRLRRN